MAEYLKKAKERPEEDISEVRDTVRQILERIKAEGAAYARQRAEAEGVNYDRDSESPSRHVA